MVCSIAHINAGVDMALNRFHLWDGERVRNGSWRLCIKGGWSCNYRASYYSWLYRTNMDRHHKYYTITSIQVLWVRKCLNAPYICGLSLQMAASYCWQAMYDKYLCTTGWTRNCLYKIRLNFLFGANRRHSARLTCNMLAICENTNLMKRDSG